MNQNKIEFDKSGQVDSKFPKIKFSVQENSVDCTLSGCWSVGSYSIDAIRTEWNHFRDDHPSVERFEFRLDDEIIWDSTLVAFLHNCRKDLLDSKKYFVGENLPTGINKLLELSKPSLEEKTQNEFSLSLELIDETLNKFRLTVISFLSFWGEWIIALFKIPTFKSKLRFEDFAKSCRSCGASALPIVTLISFLTGLTMGFVGSVQLEKFNAKIYIADLVCLAMVREMGALMVAIIMAGRTGASFAAELGSMKINEEIDSMKTFGISPMEFLILPRTLSLLLMIPLLTIYADVVGILGGLVVGTVVMDFSVLHYFEQTQIALQSMWEVYSGLIKSVFFGLIIGLVGCYKGMNSGNDSSSLGRAVTSSVVISVTLVVITDALFEITFSYLDLR